MPENSWVGKVLYFEKPNIAKMKEMLRRNIEHFLKKRKYEKLGFFEMNFFVNFCSLWLL